MDEVISIFREFSGFPQLRSARISRASTSSIIHVVSVWQQSDLERFDKTKFSRNYVIKTTESGDSYDVISRPSPCDVTQEIWNVESPSGKQRAIVRNVKDKKLQEQQYIEVWGEGRKTVSLAAEKIKVHDKIYGNDGQFGCVCWSQSEGHLLYIAEKKLPKTASFFDRNDASTDSRMEVNKGDKDETIKGDVHIYKDTWGEQLTTNSHGVLCILNLDTQHVSILENVPEHVSPGQAVWGPDDRGIVFVGWTELPWRLGLTYCYQRRNALYYLDLQSARCTELVNDEHWSVSTPTFNQDRTHLFYLDNPTGGAHRHCARLMMYDWDTQETTILVDMVASSNQDTNDFPGLFSCGLVPNCVSSDGKQIILSSQWRSRQEILAINIETKEVLALSHDNRMDDAIGSWTVQDLFKGHLLVSCCSHNQPPFLMIGQLPAWDILKKRSIDSENDELLSWRQLDDVYRWGPNKRSVIPHSSPSRTNDPFAHLGYESILYLPNNYDPSNLPPLIVSPHGGPHSAHIQNFGLGHSAYTMAGYAVLEVNFRGSTGYGEESITSLLGRIGQQDVQDVQAAVEKSLSLVDKDNVFLMGGSHGGFLITHLIGQYPDFYRAAACRNPVVHLPSMVSTSDIPDWVFTECGYTFRHEAVPTDEQIAAFARVSPVSHIDKVKTPVLMMLGEKDLRVPREQGLYYARVLQARGVPVRILMYSEDSHPLSSVDAESDVFVNTVAWFRQYQQSTAPPEL